MPSSTIAKRVPLNTRKILLIEDSPAHLLLCQETINLQASDVTVDVAQNAREGLKQLSDGPYDLVVMDYNLPDLSGSELLEKIQEVRPQCPIIVITGADSTELALEVIRAGACDYLPKFGEYHKFLPQAISTNLERTRLQEELREIYQKVEKTSTEEALLNRLIVAVHSSLDLEEVVDKAAQSLSEEFDVSRVIICLFGENNEIRIVRQVTKAELEPVPEKSLIFSKYHDLVLDVGERRPLVVLQDDTFALAEDVMEDLIAYDILSMIMVPLVYQGKLMGILHLDECETTRLWTTGDINLIARIANQLSIAVSQARLYKIVESQSKSIDKLTELCSQLNDVVSSTRELTQKQESQRKVRVKLSQREIEVLREVARGRTNKEIAETLHITEGTTEVHVSRLRKKLGLSSRAALVRYAYENHIS